jgi:hypothetical protein
LATVVREQAVQVSIALLGYLLTSGTNGEVYLWNVLGQREGEGYFFPSQLGASRKPDVAEELAKRPLQEKIEEAK